MVYTVDKHTQNQYSDEAMTQTKWANMFFFVSTINSKICRNCNQNDFIINQS